MLFEKRLRNSLTKENNTFIREKNNDIQWLMIFMFRENKKTP